MSAYDPVFAFALMIAFVYGVDLFSGVRFPERFAWIIRKNASFSFTLYLIHYSILDFFSVHLNALEPYLLLVAGLIVSNVISYGVARTTEGKLTLVVRRVLASTRKDRDIKNQTLECESR